MADPTDVVQASLAGQNGQPSRFISLAGVKPRPVRWLWQDRIPIGVGSLCAGLPGGGKTHALLYLGAMVTQGSLPGDYFGKPSGFVIMSREDMLEETIVPRLIAAEADMSRVFALPFASGSFDLDRDMPELERLVADHDVRLVGADPFLAFLDGDTFKEADVRRALGPAQRLMEEAKLSILGIAHLNKDVMKDLLSRVANSGAFTAIVRSVLFVGADPDSDDEQNPDKVLAHGKANLSRIAPSVGFRIEETTVQGEDEDGNPAEVRTTRVEWLGDSEISAEMLVKGRGLPGTKLAEAEALLRRFLAGGKGAGKVTIITEAQRLGISESTVRRAYRNLGGVEGKQERDPDTGQMGSAMWRLR